ncbi:MAG: 4-phosphoerythronate dehydrogenase, partial [Pontibacterium sp.]
MKIIADENMPFVRELFSSMGHIQMRPGREICAADVADADILLVRSVTTVDESLLSKSQLKFVGTATIGTDHIDKDYLDSIGIPFSNAAGCNADAVVDYVLASIFSLAQESQFNPFDKVWGIVGVGNVGGRLADRLAAAGVKVLLNDPPRAEADVTFQAQAVELDDLLANADIICCHTPLVKGGDHPTRHLLSAKNLGLLKQGAVLVNAGRGDVIDNQALLDLTLKRADVCLILDVWEGEPAPLEALAKKAFIATPHIAGYSLDGKARGTFMLYQACCQALGLSCEYDMAALLLEPNISEVELTASVSQPELSTLIKLV